MTSLKFLYAGGAMLVSCLLTCAAHAQGAGFDPARPFAEITSPDDWVKRFQTGAPTLDPNDRFRNMTSREWVDAWTKRPHGLTNEEFLKSYSGRGGTGVTIRSPYPYAS